MKIITGVIFLLILTVALQAQIKPLPQLKLSANGRYFTTQYGDPFFWLGDTGWLLFIKLNREQVIQYLDQRKQQGFNVIQVMVLHDVRKAVNVYGDSALVNKDAAKPRVTKGSDFSDAEQYDFWDHVDYVIDEAAKRGIYMGLVPVWGTNVKNGWVKQAAAKTYATFLANRFRNKSNIIWLNGGDIPGSDSIKIWNTIGSTIHAIDKKHLQTFHPRGRTTSSRWFHNQSWLQFNMSQSGHRNYAQDTSKGETHYGEDNWRYIQEDYAKRPIKPTLDGEPSYEGIPYGLHDTTQPYWSDKEIRRYAYWSVLAGGAGFTYGSNAVMQFYQAGDSDRAYGAKKFWQQAITDPGAQQMQYLAKLMLSKSYFDRVPDQSLVKENGERYDRVLATRGRNYALLYTYNGRDFDVVMGKIKGAKISANWFNPKDGTTQSIGSIDNTGIKHFDPPGEKEDGNDWVLILDSE
jgi:hypothetical protein